MLLIYCYNVQKKYVGNFIDLNGLKGSSFGFDLGSCRKNEGSIYGKLNKSTHFQTSKTTQRE